MAAADVPSPTPDRPSLRRVLLVDDDAPLVGALRERLVVDGYDVEATSDVGRALEAVRGAGFDLVVLEPDLERRSGLELCRELRRLAPDTALIIATARARVADRVQCLRAGADDYLVKPFDPAELVARIEACLRHRGRRDEDSRRRRFGDLTVDLARREVVRAGRPVALSARELDLLRCLVESAGTVLSRDVLLDRVWGCDSTPIPRTVDVHVAWLRRKIEDDPHRPTLIRTVHGVGYVWNPETTTS